MSTHEITPLEVSTPDGPILVLSGKDREKMRRMIAEKKALPRHYQAKLLADVSRFRRIRWSRQTGKSYSMALDSVLLGGETNKNVMQLSASADLTKELMLKTAFHAEVIGGIAGEMQREILRGGMDETLYVDSDGIKITQTTVTLNNGARIIGRPANPRTARGFTAHVKLDEFAMHKDSDEIWAAAFGSISSDQSLRLDVGSTPKGKKGRFYQICQAKTIEEGGIWSDHTLTIHQAIAQGLPNVNAAELQEALDDDQLWNQEYLVEFVDEADAFLSYELIRTCEHEGLHVARVSAARTDSDEEIVERLRLAKLIDLLAIGTGELFLGIDIGRRRDLTVFWILEKVGGVYWARGVIELHTMPFRHQQALAEAIMGQLNIRRCCGDETGIGMMLMENLTHRFGASRVEPITFTEANKARLAEHLRPKFEEQAARIPIDKRIREDLHGIKKSEGPGGHVRYAGDKSGSKSGVHPDHFWGLALGINAAEAAPVYEFTPGVTVHLVKRAAMDKGVMI